MLATKFCGKKHWKRKQMVKFEIFSFDSNPMSNKEQKSWVTEVGSMRLVQVRGKFFPAPCDQYVNNR